MPPAARLTDLHVCPLFTGIVPHVGGPILAPGAPTVLIGGLPAARVSDTATCVGPPDIIAKGAPGVLISGLPAARMLDTTVHGGLIVFGWLTVWIGDFAGPGAAPAFGPGIILEGTPAEQAVLAALLNRIRLSGPNGAALINSLETNATPTRFNIATSFTDSSGTTGQLADIGGGVMVPAGGSNSGDNEVYVDPTHLITYTGTDGNTHNETPDGLLAHEAGHADLQNQGDPSHTTAGGDAEAGVRNHTNPIRSEMGMEPELRPGP